MWMGVCLICMLELATLPYVSTLEDLASMTTTKTKTTRKLTPTVSWAPRDGGSTSQNSFNSTSTLYGKDLVGIHVEQLKVEVLDGIAVYVAGSQYSEHALIIFRR